MSNPLTAEAVRRREISAYLIDIAIAERIETARYGNSNDSPANLRAWLLAAKAEAEAAQHK